MTRKYYKRKSDNAIYYTGKDQKNLDNLINIRTGSELCLPGHYEDIQDRINNDFFEISKERALSEVPNAYGNHS